MNYNKIATHQVQPPKVCYKSSLRHVDVLQRGVHQEEGSCVIVPRRVPHAELDRTGCEPQLEVPLWVVEVTHILAG